MTQPTESAILTWPSRQVIDRTPRGRMTIRLPEHSTLPGSSNGRRIAAANEGVVRQVNPADAAQARLFEAILQMEIAQLQQLARVMESRCAEHSADDHWSPETLSELSARIADVHRLLQRLRDRFPHRS